MIEVWWHINKLAALPAAFANPARTALARKQKKIENVAYFVLYVTCD